MTDPVSGTNALTGANALTDTDTDTDPGNTNAVTDHVPPGRPVVLVPTPEGFWMALLGVGGAAVSPLFGFLVGTIIGEPGDDQLFGPLYLGLFAGIILGAVGVVAAVLGCRTLWVNYHLGDAVEKTP